jgi:hypothetical protein
MPRRIEHAQASKCLNMARAERPFVLLPLLK